MSESSAVNASAPQIALRELTVDDVQRAFEAGIEDLRSAPAFGMFFGAVYALGGLAIILFLFATDMAYLAYPMAAGFALVGPFVAVGLYEVSRRRETGEPLTWGGVLGVMLQQGKRELGWMALVTLFIFIVWMYQVRLLLALFLGFQSIGSFADFYHVLTTTLDGILFLAVGNLVGAGLSAVLFSLTVVSMPLLLDREVDFITAMITSVQAVIKNPKPMLSWALTVGVILVLAMLPFFMGLIVALPVLGHATWHLYRRTVA